MCSVIHTFEDSRLMLCPLEDYSPSSTVSPSSAEAFNVTTVSPSTAEAFNVTTVSPSSAEAFNVTAVSPSSTVSPSSADSPSSAVSPSSADSPSTVEAFNVTSDAFNATSDAFNATSDASSETVKVPSPSLRVHSPVDGKSSQCHCDCYSPTPSRSSPTPSRYSPTPSRYSPMPSRYSKNVSLSTTSAQPMASNWLHVLWCLPLFLMMYVSYKKRCCTKIQIGIAHRRYGMRSKSWPGHGQTPHPAVTKRSKSESFEAIVL